MYLYSLLHLIYSHQLLSVLCALNFALSDYIGQIHIPTTEDVASLQTCLVVSSIKNADNIRDLFACVDAMRVNEFMFDTVLQTIHEKQFRTAHMFSLLGMIHDRNNGRLYSMSYSLSSDNMDIYSMTLLRLCALMPDSNLSSNAMYAIAESSHFPCIDTFIVFYKYIAGSRDALACNTMYLSLGYPGFLLVPFLLDMTLSDGTPPYLKMLYCQQIFKCTRFLSEEQYYKLSTLLNIGHTTLRIVVLRKLANAGPLAHRSLENVRKLLDDENEVIQYYAKQTFIRINK